MTKIAEKTRSLTNSPRTGVTDSPGAEPGELTADPAAQVSSPGSQYEVATAPGRDDVRAAIGFLRGEDNPFDIFVATQSADEDFFRFHAPEVHSEVQDKIRRAIEKYAKPDYRSHHQLHPTRTLLVRGARGAGKTHLLHAIQFRDEGQHDLLVRPRYFEKQYPFAEYVIKEVVRTLLGGDEPDSPSPLGCATERITRRLVLETILSLSPSDWLRHTARPGSLGILLGRRWRKHQNRQREVVRDLNDNRAEDSTAAILRRHRVDIDTVQSLVSDHISRCELGTRSPAQMRRRLLLAILEFGLQGQIEPITTFLESGFAESGDGQAASRAALVDDLLRTLVEILAAVGVPVVIAFDNIERLLAPLGRLDPEVAQAFFSGLAQLIDGVRGILVLLFVEDGLWIQCTQQAMDSFARDRLLLGIRMRDYGHVTELPLGPPSQKALDAIVRRRMAPLRARMENSDRLPGLFPFESPDLRVIAGHSSDLLRAALLRLRDRYDELVLAPTGSQPDAAHKVGTSIRGPEVAASPALAVPERVSQLQVEREVLQPKWDNSITRALRRLETTPRSSLAGELHAGLGRWLETFVDAASKQAPIETDGASWRLSRVDTGITFGDHPTFGLLTVGHWRPEAGGQVRRVGIGLVLATGSSMPRDLAVKLSVLRVHHAPADELVVLWPDRDAEFQPGDLPAASRRVWDEQAAQESVALCGVPMDELVWLLALNDWLNDIAEFAQPGWPDDATRHFLLARTRSLLARLVPRPPLKSV